MMRYLLKRFAALPSMVLVFLLCSAEDGCEQKQTSAQIESTKQEQINKQAAQVCGMPNISNFREKFFLHDCYESRDQGGIVTYIYVFSQYQACFVYIGPSAGYPIPYATQYSAPQKIDTTTGYHLVIPQAEPNGLYPPASAEGTWILAHEPVTAGKNRLVESQAGYMEERINAFPYKLPDRLLCPNSKGL